MQHERFKPHAVERWCNPTWRAGGGMQAGDVEVTRAVGSNHSHQDRTGGPIETILW